MIDEAYIDRMIVQGRKITDEAVATYKPDAIIAAFSGGNDSIVSTHFAVEQYGATVVHCDTGIGIRKTRSHVDNTATRYGWDLRVSHASPSGKPGPLDPSSLPVGRWTDAETAYEEFVLNHGFPGPAQHGRMYQRLKERPLLRVARELRSGRAKKVLVISGIRHDESSVRAGYKRAIQAPPKTFLVWTNPFYYHTAMDFESYRDEFGLPRNPVKARVGISGECLCGAYASEGEKELVRSVEPETAGYLDRLEDRVRANGFPWGWGEQPPKAYLDSKRGQMFMFPTLVGFEPMCVGCARKCHKKGVVANAS
jgi:hypothetical protein